jgi:hypothetical protein
MIFNNSTPGIKFYPNVDMVSDFGSALHRWREGYFYDLYSSNLYGKAGVITNFILAGTFTTNTVTDGQIARYNATDARWYSFDFPNTNSAIIDATNRVAGVGYLLPVSTQNLVTASVTNGLASLGYVDAATNSAIIDATNRVAGMGYLLPASTNDCLTDAKSYTDTKAGKTSLVFGPITTNASPDNYAVLGPLPYALTITNLIGYGDGGTWVADYWTSDRTNIIAGRTLIYTGLTYTVGTLVTNLPVNISVAAGKWIGCVLTNGASPTNAWSSAEGTY